jgi:hypothetical protein
MAAAEARQTGWHSGILRALELRPAIVIDALDPAGTAGGVAARHGAQLQHPERCAAPSDAAVRDQRRTPRKDAEGERANGE